MNFLKRIFSPLCVIISILCLSYTFYKSEIYWNGEKSDYYLIYYIVSFALLIFSFFSFFLGKVIKEYLIISGFSVITSLLLFEIYLNVYEKISQKKTDQQLLKNQLYKTRTGMNFDLRNKFEIYKDLKKTDNSIVVVVTPKTFFNKKTKIFPMSSVSLSKTIHCNENGYYAIYKSDRNGFNNPDQEWDKDKIEYFLIGDSFTHGACVDRPNDIGSVLRDLYEAPTLNLGFGGNGPLIEYATLKEYLKPNVKKVIWLYFPNDLYNLELELKDETLIKYLNIPNFTQNLKSKQSEIDIMINKVIQNESSLNTKNLKDIIKLKKLRTKLNFYLPSKYKPQQKPKTHKEFKKIILMAKNLIEKNNSKFYFVYLPEYAHFQDNYDKENYNFVKNLMSELEISFIDMYKEVFSLEESPLKFFPFELDGHYNEEGYKKIAEAIYKFSK